MQLTLGRTLTTLGVVIFLIVMLGTAGSQGFFGDMFEGLDMFGDMFARATNPGEPGIPLTLPGGGNATLGGRMDFCLL